MWIHLFIVIIINCDPSLDLLPNRDDWAISMN